jgi:diadenosine tetraphosphate (Ap4A) HIT family hydrolase
MSAWPPDFARWLSGEACPLCAEGRPDEVGDRVRFFSSEVADGYLHLRGVQRGYAALIWRGRHVAEPTDLTDDEAAAFWRDLLRVGRAMQAVYRPLKMNYVMMGNRIPHLHWLLAPRFWDDVAPGDPIPAFGYANFPEADVRQDVAALKAILAPPT